jgi:hypothetical protein
VNSRSYLSVFPPQAVARRGEWNDLAAVLDWLGIADCSCHQINPYFAGWRADPAVAFAGSKLTINFLAV